MRKECEDALKAGQPALIVTYGNTTRKHRPLDRDIFVMGRAPACDVGLVSPEVAPVHCVILRAADGWRIRDCSGGRYATRVNGRAIQEESLHDADMLQIGTFSFEVRLPAVHATPIVGSTPIVDDRLATRLKRLQRSRRNLVRLALKMRKRAQQGNTPPPTLAELQRQADCLRGLQRDYNNLLEEYESRLDEVEKAEREVCDERAAFERDSTEQRTRLEKAEHDLARRLAEAETRLRQVPQAPAGDASATLSPEWAVVLDRRSQELNHFARHLRRCRQQLTPSPHQENEAERKDAERWGEQCLALQTELAALDARAQQRHAELAAEREQARREADILASTVKELQAVSESLRREIHDRDVVLEKLRRQLEQQSAQANLENSGSYERELNAFRLELERDRQDVNEQLCQLQVRQAEMEAAARESELQMSRERATIARERAELTRLRDDIRIAKDRTTREGGIRDRLSRIHHLKQELASAASVRGDQAQR